MKNVWLVIIGLGVFTAAFTAYHLLRITAWHAVTVEKSDKDEAVNVGNKICPVSGEKVANGRRYDCSMKGRSITYAVRRALVLLKLIPKSILLSWSRKRTAKRGVGKRIDLCLGDW